MNTIVVYKSKYGSTKAYAEWIAQELGCKAEESKNININDLIKYDTIIYGGGLYAEIISGVNLITKNLDKLKNKKLIVYSTGLTPLHMREYYDNLVLTKNFPPQSLSKIKVYNFLGKMIFEELTPPHKAAIKLLKKIMSCKPNPTDMEQLLIKLCDTSGDFTDKTAIAELVAYARSN